MNITLDNPTILGITNNYEFTPGGISLRQIQTVSLEGLLLSLNNQTGVYNIWNQIKTYNSNSFDGFITITINGVTYTNARINSLNFNESENQDVLTKPFSLEFENYTEFGSSNDKDYLESYALQNVESISDNFSLNLADGNIKEYSHSFNINYFNTTGAALLSASRTIAQGILTTNKYALSILGGGYTDSYKRYYTETFDVFKGSYSLEETFSYVDDIQNNTSVSLGYFLQLGNNGVLTVTEEGSIQGLINDKYTNALNQFNILYPAAKNRCDSFVSDMSSELTNVLTTLKNEAISRSVTRDQFLGTINYSIQFSNELRYDTVIKDFTIDFNRREDGFFEVTENGTYTAYGKTSAENPSTNTKFLNALTDYESDYSTAFQASAKTNLPGLAQGLIIFGSSPNKYYPLSVSISYNVTEGKITFTHNYSNEKTYDDSTFRSVTSEYSEEDALASIQTFQVPGLGLEGGKELSQFLTQSTPIKQSVKVTIKGKSETQLQTYIDNFKSYIPDLKQPDFLLSKNYDFNPINHTFNGTAEWILFDKRNRTRNNFTVNQILGY